MAKRKGKSGSGEMQYSITQANLDKKGKTNKKLKMNTQAGKFLTPKGKEIIEAAKALQHETIQWSIDTLDYKGLTR
jgi:predicted transcriptional regulator